MTTHVLITFHIDVLVTFHIDVLITFHIAFIFFFYTKLHLSQQTISLIIVNMIARNKDTSLVNFNCIGGVGKIYSTQEII